MDKPFFRYFDLYFTLMYDVRCMNQGKRPRKMSENGLQLS